MSTNKKTCQDDFIDVKACQDNYKKFLVEKIKKMVEKENDLHTLNFVYHYLLDDRKKGK